MLTAITLILAYFIGSLPFGLLLTRLAGLGDIRNIGSGNIGATNVMRTGQKGLALITLLLDAGKGAFAIWIAAMVKPDIAPYAGLVAVLGHCFPAWLKFKGGKGVATSLGVLAMLSGAVTLMTLSVWLLVFATYRVSSVAALVSAMLAPFFAYALADTTTLWVTLALSLLLIIRHVPNIKRLIAGEERKIPLKRTVEVEKSKSPPPAEPE